jgi:hypothetical protein
MISVPPKKRNNCMKPNPGELARCIISQPTALLQAWRSPSSTNAPRQAGIKVRVDIPEIIYDATHRTEHVVDAGVVPQSSE